ncbi:microsomal triacylglycerol transfer protein isoform X1 [Rhynchophorus ferrugineus]|uniref:microsomal triacylglycerol transfer protein isoform X1 n=1 Tax=Rhynchophorus ferrugineus TaxID=354439 RepID=UPI003FCC5AFA
MTLRINVYSILYTTLFTLCSGFVLISSASGAGSHLELFSLGESLVYQWKSTVLLNEVDRASKNVGFFINGKVTVTSIWENGNKKILKIELTDPKLHVKSRKNPVPEGFVSHTSNLDSANNKPFLVLWLNGVIKEIYLDSSVPLSIRNIYKGIASIFQITSLDKDITEQGISGICNVTYTSSALNSVTKSISKCMSPDINNLKQTNNILGTTTTSEQEINYILDDSNKFPQSIKAKELHQIFLNAKEEFGGSIIAEQEFKLIENKQSSTLKANSFEEALNEFSAKQKLLNKETLVLELETASLQNQKKFSKEVDILREQLESDYLGSSKSAKAFIQLLQIARVSGVEDISKALNSKKNSNILAQLYDTLGYAQTKNSHKAVMKKLPLDSEEHIDFIERYLWALSFSSHPNIDILEDLLNKYRKYSTIPEKIRDTLILSLASMARTVAQSGLHDYETSKVLRNVEETILNGLDYAKDEDRYVFFNALKNLQSPSTIPNILAYIQNGTLKEETLAWRAIKSFNKQYWDNKILKQAEKTLFQLDKKHDTSSRTLAVDIILGAGTNEATLEHLLNFIAGKEKKYEIKQYVFQSIKMLSDRNTKLNELVNKIIKRNKMLNNYSTLSPRGLSTALARDMFKGFSSNGSLISIQEIKSGIVKRGVVDVVLEKNNIPKELFTLGIFSGGLTSFMSSGDNDNEEPDESATAGMELTVLGTQIRPFIFFDGQGELMGHVWSGTASDMTPAFQALILWQDHEDYIRLGNGFTAEVNFKGGLSFDLSGKISISLWNRNAESLIQKSVGLMSIGSIRIPSSFVRSKVEFEASVEPKLSLEIDADFSSNVKLCMRLSQPDCILKHQISKLERIPDSNHQIKITSTRMLQTPGLTYSLNRKNNEMCSAIFS